MTASQNQQTHFIYTNPYHFQNENQHCFSSRADPDCYGSGCHGTCRIQLSPHWWKIYKCPTANILAKQTYYVDDSLPNHTLFHPEDLSSFESIPVVVWGNGACSDDPVALHGPFLEELAAHGLLVIASGTPGGSGTTTSEMMTESIDWATQNAGQGDWANIDSSQIAAAGMSCGGLEAYDMNQDDRVTAFGIFNSGILDQAETDETLAAINVPIFFFLGGPTDIAYENVSPAPFSSYFVMNRIVLADCTAGHERLQCCKPWCTDLGG